MITIRKGGERGRTRLDWLDSRHTFSFGKYHDPAHAGFRTLRVINEDRVRPAGGFSTHAHRDMEILSFVLAGALEHKDSMGAGSIIRTGDVQRMSAGTGITHSEFNPSKSEPVHFLQVWILPEREGIEPGYEQRSFSPEEKRGRWRLVASRGGRDGSLTIHQDADVYVTLLDKNATLAYPLRPGRHAWIHVARGAVSVAEHGLGEGDGAAISGEARVEVHAGEPAELLLFDLA